MNTRRALWSQWLLIALLSAAVPIASARERAPRQPVPQAMPVMESAQLKSIVQKLLQDNDEFAHSRTASYFQTLAAGQAPRATVVTCSDSRVHTHALDKEPDGDLFMIRNIGNQLSTSEGSVEYGVHHLHTPLLIIIGHSSCGAIKAASGDYRRESRAIKRELDTIKIPKGIPSMEGVLRNVNNQVAAAIKKFNREIKEGSLTVIGAVYDFSNELGRGYGKLNIVNVNGETDPFRLKMLPVTAFTPKPAAPPAEKAAEKEKKPASKSMPTMMPSGGSAAPPSFP